VTDIGCSWLRFAGSEETHRIELATFADGMCVRTPAEQVGVRVTRETLKCYTVSANRHHLDHFSLDKNPLPIY